MITADTKIASALAEGLAAEDVAALRVADAVTFHTFRGRGYVRAHKRVGPGRDVFTAREQRLYPDPDGRERLREIGADYALASAERPGALAATQWAAFYMIGMAQYVPSWQTIAALLRTGDVLQLAWLADNNSDNIRDAGLHADELRLHVMRSGRVMTFQIAHSVTPDNSARMIHRDR